MVPLRTYAGVAVLAAIALLTNVDLLLQAVSVYNHADLNSGGIGAIDDRFSELRQVLPKNAVLGYIRDPQSTLAEPNITAEFYQTQYALTPWLLVNSTDQPLVLGNFLSLPNPQFLKDRHLEVVRTFSNGVTLLRRTP